MFDPYNEILQVVLQQPFSDLTDMKDFFQVASRQVFLCTGIFYLLFGILGKFSAVFITIPYPVLGGASVAMFSALFGVVTSNLQVIWQWNCDYERKCLTV